MGDPLLEENIEQDLAKALSAPHRFAPGCLDGHIAIWNAVRMPFVVSSPAAACLLH